MRTLSLTLALAAAMIVPAFAEESPTPPSTEEIKEKPAHGDWVEVNSQEDWTGALAKAKKENKLVLVDFTGSDWCGWCIRLKKEVFSQEHFMKEAPKNFILVEVDLPRRTQPAEDVMAFRKGLAAEYKVQSYPTILVLDSTGSRIGKTGYRKGGPEGYVEHLLEIKKEHTVFEELKTKAEGGDKAAVAKYETAKNQKKLKKLLGSINQRNVKQISAKIYELHKKGVELEKGKANAQYQFVLLQAAMGAKDVNLFDDARVNLEKLSETNPQITKFLQRYNFDKMREKIAPAEEEEEEEDEEPMGELEG